MTEENTALARNNKILMILPDVTVELMKLVLQWSVTGHADLTNQDILAEATSLLRTFDSCAEISVEEISNSGIKQSDVLSEPKEVISAVERKLKSSMETKRIENPKGTQAKKRKVQREKCTTSEVKNVQVESVDNDVIEVDLTLDDNEEAEGSEASPSPISDTLPPYDTNKEASDMFSSSGAHSYDIVDEKIILFDSDAYIAGKVEDSVDDDQGDPIGVRRGNFEKTEVELDSEYETKSNLEMSNEKPLVIKISKGTKNVSSKSIIVCQLCNKTFKQYFKFVYHLSVAHYQSQLLDLFGPDKSACKICKKTMNNHRINRTIHMGVAHKQVFNVAHASVKKQLDTLRAKDKLGKPEPVAWSHCKSHFLNKKDGWSCCQDYMNSPQDLTFHLASVHYENDFAASYGTVGLPCKQCKVDRQYTAMNREDVIQHLSSSHSSVLYKLMPDEDAMLLQRCFNKKNHSISKKYKCPMCDRSFDGLVILKWHLSSLTHFQKEILKHASRERDCSMCRKLAGNQTRMGKSQLARHLGVTHGFLNNLLPKYTKEALKRMESIQSDTKAKCTLPSFKGTDKEHAAPIKKATASCPLCPRRCTSMYLIESHLAVSHYKEEIFKTAGLVNRDSTQCPQCHMQLVPSQKNCTPNNEWHLARHLGMAHGYLDMVIPDEVKAKLEKISSL